MARIWNKHKQTNTPLKRKVFVALSGGVDSAVAAWLLKKEGYLVTGVFMKNWSDCDWQAEKRAAMKVAAHLDIPFFVWDFEKEYRQQVLTNFYKSYRLGETPNPDVLCNRDIKFGIFLKKALAKGAGYIATGHYARIQTKKISGNKHEYYLLKGKDNNKDQSYFLWALKGADLKKIKFPLGDLTKPAVRVMAKKANLPNYDKKDSQGICFIGQINLKNFLSRKIKPKPGLIINESGAILGRHEGVYYYTEGQRAGLNLGGLKEPHYIAVKDLKKNIIMVAPRQSHWFNNNKIILREVRFINSKPLSGSKIAVKIRYRQPDQKAIFKKKGRGAEIIFRQPQFGLSLGQSLVIYNRDVLVGGGIIDKIFKPVLRLQNSATSVK